MAEYGIDRALFIGMPALDPGTPGVAGRQGRLDPDNRAVEVGTYDEWLALPTSSASTSAS